MMHPGLWLQNWIIYGSATFIVGVVVTHWIPSIRVRDGIRTFLFALIFTFGGYGEGRGFVPIPVWSVFIYSPPNRWLFPMLVIVIAWLLLFGLVTAIRWGVKMKRSKASLRLRESP
jgi:hypothetical protein